MTSPSEYLVRVALAVLGEGVTEDEAEKMVKVLISRKNKVDNAHDAVMEASRLRREAMLRRMSGNN